MTNTQPEPDTARLHDRILTLEADLATVRDLLRTENARANSAIDRETTAEDHAEEQRLALSQALGLGTGAPWDAIRDRAAELAAVSVPAPAPAARAALRDRIAETLWPLTDWDGDRLNVEAATDAVLSVLPANQTTDRADWDALVREAGRLRREGAELRDRAEEIETRIAEIRLAVLSPAERQFLTFALDLAADQMASCSDEFDDADEAALNSLRRLAAEAQPECSPACSEQHTYSHGCALTTVGARQQPDTRPPAASPAETAEQIATDLRDGGRHERALGAEDVAAVLRASERLAKAQQPAVVSQPDEEA